MPQYVMFATHNADTDMPAADVLLDGVVAFRGSYANAGEAVQAAADAMQLGPGTFIWVCPAGQLTRYRTVVGAAEG